LSQGLGKVSREFMKEVVFKHTGARNKASIVGPGLGLDNAILSLGGGRVMVATADPLTMIPSIGMEESAWLTIHELASDVTTSGVPPQFAMLEYNLPPELEMEEFEAYVRAMSRECRRLGIAIIGGHTGKYPGCGFTVVGGGVLMGIADEEAYVTPKMIEQGDCVIMTKGAGIETTAVLSLAFPQKVGEALGREARVAQSYLKKCTTVEDALTAASVGLRKGGVTSMHDATEGGVLGALYELAKTSGATIEVERGSIHVSEATKMLCGLFGLDPLVTLSEGALIVTCARERSERVLAALRKKNIEAFVIGSVKGTESRLLVSQGGKSKGYVPPEFDPYWNAYTRALKNGWK
jgi:hydrogenase expression/formation protein HypE